MSKEMTHSLIKPPGNSRESSAKMSLASGKGLASSEERVTKIKKGLAENTSCSLPQRGELTWNRRKKVELSRCQIEVTKVLE